METNDERPSYKRRAPMKKPASIERVEAVIADRGFVEFSKILGLRILTGNSASAFRMLKSIDAPSVIAYQIIDEWAASTDGVDKRIAVFLTPVEIAAVYFSGFIDDLAYYDWTKLLLHALEEAGKDSSG